MLRFALAFGSLACLQAGQSPAPARGRSWSSVRGFCRGCWRGGTPAAPTYRTPRFHRSGHRGSGTPHFGHHASQSVIDPLSPLTRSTWAASRLRCASACRSLHFGAHSRRVRRCAFQVRQSAVLGPSSFSRYWRCSFARWAPDNFFGRSSSISPRSAGSSAGSSWKCSS